MMDRYMLYLLLIRHMTKIAAVNIIVSFDLIDCHNDGDADCKI